MIKMRPELWGDCYANGELVIDSWDCPTCHASYAIEYERHNFCPQCGQAINWEDDTTSRPTDRVTRMMEKAGIQPHLEGYDYLIEAIEYAEGIPKRELKMMDVYEQVANLNDVNLKSVERAMRYAVKKAGKRGVKSFVVSMAY